MAVTIINRTPDQSVVKQVVCRNCCCTLEYTPNDVREEKHYDYRRDTDIYKKIDCPNCNKPITVS